MSDLITFHGKQYRRDTSGWYRVYEEGAAAIYHVGVEALDEIERLQAEIHDARESLPCVRMQDHFDDTLAEAIKCTLGQLSEWREHGRRLRAEIERLQAIVDRIAAVEGCECDSYEGHKCALCKVRAMAREVGE